MEQSDSEFIGHEPCEECGSSDGKGIYTDGHTFCFVCSHWTPGDGDAGTPRERPKLSKDLIALGEANALPGRKLKEETCAKYGYTVSEMAGQPVQVANYRDLTGRIVAQKVRFKNKDFKFIGETKEAPLYGAHLCRDGGKRIVITEGEVDALSVSQAQGNKWPAVSVQTGAQGAHKSLSNCLEWLLKFDEIVLMFDDDGPGRKAAERCALLFPPGRCKIARIEGYKDANEALQDDAGDKIINAIFAARAFRPDGVVTIGDVKDLALVPPTMGLPWYGEKLTRVLYGRRMGEIIAIGAGTGVGKTELLAEQIYYDLVHLGQPVGVFLLEQQPWETVQRIAGKHAGKEFHVPNRDDEEPRWTTEELADAIAAIESRPLFMYDSFGATDWDVIQATIRHLHHAEGVNLFYLDHLTALAAAEDDERTGLERIMAEMGSLVKELGITIIMVSHLSTPEGKPHEEGGRVMIRHFKGSRAIGFWCHTMVGLERNQQAEDPAERTTTTIRVLKHRPVGRAVGETVFYRYSGEEGRLLELDHDPSEETQNDEYDFSGGGDTDLPF